MFKHVQRKKNKNGISDLSGSKVSEHESTLQSAADLRPVAVAQRSLNALLDERECTMQMKALRDLTQAHVMAVREQANVARGQHVLQRQLKFTDTAETFNEITPFLLKYGMGETGKGVQAKSSDISDLIEKGEHTYKNIWELLTTLGYEKPKEEDQFKVGMVLGELGAPGVEIAEGDVLKGVKSSKQSSQPLYEINLSGKRFMLKKQPDGKSEFKGMQEMAVQGISVPATIWLLVEGLGDSILMEYISTLGSGLATMNSISKEEMAGPAKSLGKMHTTDVKIGNVDRLPWAGNGYSGHLNNVFTDLVSRKIIALDSESNLNINEDFLHVIKSELKEIKADPVTYAEKIYALLIREGNKDKLTISPEVAAVFKENFSIGLGQALPDDIDALGVQSDLDDF